MLRPANVVDLPVLRALIRDGAVTGSIDRELASESREAALFFANLRQALATGYFVEEEPLTGDLITVAVPGYVYLPDGEAVDRPIGFGLFKAIAVGYELWLTGLATAWRGHGHGRGMLTALLNTPPGKQTYLVRLNTEGRESATMGHLLLTMGYNRAQKSPLHTWYLRNDAPQDLHRDLIPPLPRMAS